MKLQQCRISTCYCASCRVPLIGVYVVAHQTSDAVQTYGELVGLGCLSCGTQYDPQLRSVRRVRAFKLKTASYLPERETWIPRAA
jgi:hypothetical protein